MNRLLILLTLLAAFALGCGGGGGGTGGGGSTVITGRVVWLPTGSAPSPSATVQIGSRSVPSDPSDGSFQLSIDPGATQVTVVYSPPGGATVSFTFTVPALTADTDLGDLWIGPEKVTVVGKVLSAADGAPVSGALVRFGGQTGLSGADGSFSLSPVAYSKDDLGVFLGIEGQASRPGFLAGSFLAQSEAVGGVVDVGEVLLTPESSNEPPGLPTNLFGRVFPAEDAPGTVITLLQGGNPIRQATVGSDQRYRFWAEPGTYTLRFANPNNGKSAPDRQVTLNSPDDQVEVDVTLQ